PFFDFAHLRIPGVLQRIAVCYLFASLIFLNSNWKQQVTVVLFLLFYYWLLMTLVPVPGCASWSISDKTCNLAAWTDRAILGANHIWKQGIVYDPEGVLSTLPAIASCLFGVLAGSWIKTKRTVEDKTNGMLAYGLILMAVGWAWSFWMPFNKSLWTSSYVVFTGGTALCFLGVCTWLIDIKGYTKWSKPFVVFGTNALVLFVGSGLVAKLMGIIKFENAAGKKVAIKTIIYKNLFVPLFDPYNASLAFALVFILISLFLIWLLYRRRIFIRL
ncbi:MAG: DUF5009 domain-containing protein, partial [Acidobacteria bacterium]|nr:DUF5009 domain-containing protein [Acidobacteriota bacterium]